MLKKSLVIALTAIYALLPTATAATAESIQPPTYLKAVINTEDAVEFQKSNIFDASQSFIPNPESTVTYSWDFGDGNTNEGIEVLHAYRNPGRYSVTLTIDDGTNTSQNTTEVFAYRSQIILITDKSEAQERTEVLKNFAEEKGVHIKLIESFGTSTEFISEEILTTKLNEESASIPKANQIIIWTKENAGLNAISRYIRSNQEKSPNSLSQKNIIVILDNIQGNINRIQRQFKLINPRQITLAKEAAVNIAIESQDDAAFQQELEEGGYEFEVITGQTGRILPWNFMSHLVSNLIDNGIPDNTIALLLLLPVIATVIAFMKQVVGMTTFGIYTPSIITLSFLIIGVYAGILTLTVAILVGAISRPLLKKVRMLFIPKMAIVITIVSLALLLLLTINIYLSLFDAEFLAIAIFPMLILSTLVEKFVSVKSSKGLSSAAALMISTVVVSLVAYVIVGGEINFGLFILKIDFIKLFVMNYPEVIILLIGANILLGKWSGLRILERVRFKEVLRHIEE